MAIPDLVHEFADSSDAPLYVVNWPAQITEGEIDGFFLAARELCQKIDVPWGIVFDLSRFNGPSQAGNRSAFARGVNNLDALLEHLAAGAMVVNSPIARGMATAVLWVLNKPYQTKMFAQLGTAKQWVQSHIQASTAAKPTV